jgi:phosphate:Na+ symporter
MASMVMLDLMGGVALLLWGLHMVRSGVIRAFGSDLRRTLGLALGNRFTALLAGLGLTAVLQSSTATGLMTASFTAAGHLDLVTGLAVMLGANIGTTVIVQVLSFNMSAAAPALFVAGLIAFNRGRRTWVRDVGRVAIGLGLMLLALHILLDSLTPAENAPSVRALLAAITGEPVLCVALAALLTWAAHSSAAVVLLIMSLAYSHFITPIATLALVLGANLGAAVNPILDSGTATNPASRRLPAGNMINRMVGVAVVFPFLQPIADFLVKIDPDPARMAADFHSAINIALALAFVLVLDQLAPLLVRVLPDRTQSLDPSAPLYLDAVSRATPVHTAVA